MVSIPFSPIGRYQVYFSYDIAKPYVPNPKRQFKIVGWPRPYTHNQQPWRESLRTSSASPFFPSILHLNSFQAQTKIIFIHTSLSRVNFLIFYKHSNINNWSTTFIIVQENLFIVKPIFNNCQPMKIV